MSGQINVSLCPINLQTSNSESDQDTGPTPGGAVVRMRLGITAQHINRLVLVVSHEKPRMGENSGSIGAHEWAGLSKPLNLQTARHPDISNHSSVQWHTKHMSLAKNADASDNQTITDISDRHALQTD